MKISTINKSDVQRAFGRNSGSIYTPTNQPTQAWSPARTVARVMRMLARALVALADAAIVAALTALPASALAAIVVWSIRRCRWCGGVRGGAEVEMTP